MQITFHGAAQTVTGSQHLLEIDGKRILLDCGLFQGKREESRERNRTFKHDPSKVDVLVLSHAHIDHSGNIPNLVRNGFRGNIVCTEPTQDLCNSMLQDSGFIQEKDVEYVNKQRRKHGEPPVEPIYTQQDAIESLKRFVSTTYEKPYDLFPGVTVTFLDAGHMLGSSIVALDIQQNSAQSFRLVFSGDLGRPNVPILRDPVSIHRADALILESTYGGKTHPPVEESSREMARIITRAYERGGKVIVPAFAVERTQMLVYLLNKLFHEGNLPDIPVYVDSPLAVNVTDVFRRHPGYFDDETRDYMSRSDPDHDVFGFSRLRYIRDVEDSKKLNDMPEPCVIISASGMAEAGRVQHHLKNNIENPRNTVLIVGFQAPDTLGRRLVEKRPKVKIFGDEYDLKAEVVSLSGFSGHADHPGLMSWVAAIKDRPEQIFLVHGEPDPARALAESLQKDLGYQKVHTPQMHQTFTL